ncbi:hypothetical protein KCU81_g7599, partial [Aureobasidium melanogenum]|uniref:Uncharacterized protein n=1 Tax=Aureobasidium melanogenum (strain CBS 110374) TaxID=1043003 RepID=A0A074VE01_AURM1
MFGGFGAASNYASYIDPFKERPQPDPPTHVGLPNYARQENLRIRDWHDESDRPNLRRDFVESRKVSDITAKFYADLNIRFAIPCPVDQLVPTDHESRPYMPSNDEEWNMTMAENTNNNQGNFVTRLVELKTENDIAYRTVTRTNLPEGLTKIRLSDFRTFFTALHSMSEHWETDLDDYFVLDDDGKSVREEDHPEYADPDMTIDVRNLEEPIDLGPATPLTYSELIARDQGSPPLSKVISHGSDASSDDFLRELYRGRRTSTGSKMPWVYRMDVIKGFMEAAAFPFRCKLGPPRVHPTLLLSGVRLPVNYQSFMVHRVPKEKEKRHMVQGPLMAAYVRKELEDFDSGSDDEKRDKLRLDQLKEVGSLLHLAQERRRQGREEKIWAKPIPKSGKYWFSEMASDAAEPETPDMDDANDLIAAALGKEAAAQFANGKKKKRSQYEIWKSMEPMRSFWDPNSEYQAIGKEEGSEWDTVYVLSSMYYHVSILKLRVHGAYLDFVATGNFPEKIPEDKDWCHPVLQRSKWFDLFNVKDRIEAFRCLWGIMCYLTR